MITTMTQSKKPAKNQKPDTTESNQDLTTPDKWGNIVSSMKNGSDRMVGILGGVVGDYLDKKENGLATPMQLIYKGKPLSLNKKILKKELCNPSTKVCLLVHGLLDDDKAWEFSDAQDTKITYGSLLERDLDYTSVSLKYNTGLHISKNGQKLSDLLEEFITCYPVKITEAVIIAHSMGGLVTRSAGYIATMQKRKWVKKIKKIIFLGTPHQGTALEKFGNIVSHALKIVPRPYMKLAGDVINLRSSGIKDLRYGYTNDEDWKNQDPNALLQNNKKPIPLLKTADHYIISGRLTKKDNHPVSILFGDSLVRRPSALGKSKIQKLQISFDLKNHIEFPNVNHRKLSKHMPVYKQIKTWCQ